MKSPFPGMDPFIEACGLWEDFHNHLIHLIHRAVAPQLPDGYVARTSVRRYIVLLNTEGKDENFAKPDITIVPAQDVPTESVPMRAFIAEEFKETFVEIYAQRDERILVTCIEMLSSSNKRPATEGWEQYERKRQAMLLGRANFIEIDLLRGGHKMPMLDPWPESPYTLLVCRRRNAPKCRVWLAHFRRPLPVIPVPLLAPDPDLSLDLNPLITDIYTLGRYDEEIDYTQPLTPALSGNDTAWMRDLLKDRTPRSKRKSRHSS